jgi:hypothetical protein
MQTLEWNSRAIARAPLQKPVRVRQRPGWDGHRSVYTAVPLDMLDSVRAMLKACGYKLRTFYVGPRPADSRMDAYYRDHGRCLSWSVTAATTRKRNARYAKILVSDPVTKQRMYF